jgi:tetratricopeptide (TPR) repeat protein
MDVVVAWLAFMALAWMVNDRAWRAARHLRRARRLETRLAVNPDDQTARRDLALIRMDQGASERPILLLVEARRRDPESAELALLHGKALVASGRLAEALGPLVAAAARNHRQGYGEAYLVAARALEALGRWPEAIDALERYVGIHGSSVEAWVRLARALHVVGDQVNAAQALAHARRCWGAAPPFRRRAERWWYLRARLSL